MNKFKPIALPVPSPCLSRRTFIATPYTDTR